MRWFKKRGSGLKSITTIRRFPMNSMTLLGALLLICLTSVQAAGWDARTTRTNTAVTDQDIQSALNQAITPVFTQAFPDQKFGIHVLIDRHVSPALTGELVYLSLGLCHRVAGGEYLLAAGRLSDVVVLPQNTAAHQQRQAVVQKLGTMAAEFSRLMVQNKASIGKADRNNTGASVHWSQWPDYPR
jgi:hypothetical protein